MRMYNKTKMALYITGCKTHNSANGADLTRQPFSKKISWITKFTHQIKVNSSWGKLLEKKQRRIIL